MTTETTTALMIPEDVSFDAVLTVEDKRRAVLLDVRKRALKMIEGLDYSVKKNRDEARSVAYKVARSKTALDDHGKSMVEKAKQVVDAMNEARREIRDELDRLKGDVVKAAEAYEKAEAERVEALKQKIEALRGYAGGPPAGMSIDDMQMRLDRIEALDPASLQEFEEIGASLRDQAIAAMKDAIEAEKKRLADAAELEELRRLKDEMEAKAQKEAAEKAEAERVEREKREAEEKAQRLKEEEAARKEREDRIRKEAAEQAAMAERQRLEAEAKAKAEKEAAEKRAAEDAEAKRQANKKHQEKVRRDAADALMNHHDTIGGSEARAIIADIEAGKIPNVTLNF